MEEQLILKWNSTAHTWWNWMWSMSWQLVILVLVLGVLTWLLRNRSARLRYALWLLVPIRLVLPPTLALVTGWGWWVLPADDVTETQAQKQTLVSTPAINYSETLVDATPVQHPSQSSQSIPMPPTNPLAAELPATEADSSASAKNESVKTIRQVPTKSARTIKWQSWLFLGWGLGAVFLLARLVYGLTQAYGLIRRSEVPHCSDVAELLEKCRRSMGLRRSVRVRELEGSGVPMLVGIFRPTIILPQNVNGRLTSGELEAVLFHELHHVSRLDAFVNLVQSVLASVYFFHPFVWIANRVLSRLCEDACDEATVAALKGQRSDYGAGIVKIAEMVADRPPGAALGIISRKSQIKRRLQRILDPRLSLGRRLSWSGLALLLVLGTILLPSAARPTDTLTSKKVEPSSVSESLDNQFITKADGQKKDEVITQAEKTVAKKESSEDQLQEPAEDQVTLSGTVLDEEGKPAPKVKVFVEWKYPKRHRVETETDDLGRFTLQASSQKLLQRMVQATSDSGQQQAQYQLPWVNMESDFSLNNLRLQLKPVRRVKLHVVDGVGKPIANAKTGIKSRFQVWGTNTTDEQGNVVFLVPQDVQIQYVFALSNGHGVDYKAYVLPRGHHGDKLSQPPALPDHPVRLTLNGVKPLQVQVVETDGSPIAGVKVYPWLLEKPDQPQKLNLSFFQDLVQETTDQSGKAVLGWIPHWQKNKFMIWFHDKDYVRERATYNPEDGNGTLTMKLDKLVPLKGRVTYPDGSPAKDISIIADGAGYQPGQFQTTVKTDRAGRYTLMAAPNRVYLMIVDDKKWASKPHTGFALWPGKPIENLDFKLRPATRLFGRVTVGSPPMPVKGQAVSAYQFGVPYHSTYHSSEKLKLPNPKNRRHIVRPAIQLRTLTNKNGEFELFVGDGKFQFSRADLYKQKMFEISGELEKQFAFHTARPETGLLEGSVVSGNPPQPVSGAQVHGIYRNHLASLDMRAVTDESGHFKVERSLDSTAIYACSKDKKMAGIVQIGPDDKKVTIPIGPLGTVTGLLIDSKTKKPLKEREVSYGVSDYPDGQKATISNEFGGTTTTDVEGRFKIHGLVLGHNYNINLVTPEKDQPDRVRHKIISKVKPEDTKPINLGVREIDTPLSFNKPSSTKKKLATATQPAKKESSEDRQQKPPEDLVTLRGTVVDAKGKPAPKVKVFVDWKYPERDRVETETDDLGRFSIQTPSQKLQYGQVVQAIADSGQQQAKYQLPYQLPRKNIENDQSLKKLRLQLHPARRVELDVVDGIGNPIKNAKTGIMSSGKVWGVNTTDEQGNATFLVPHDVQIQYVFALSNGHGVDYKAYVFPRGFGGQNARAPVLPDHSIRLTLDGVKPLQVQVMETDDSPIAGIQVSPWILEKPDQPEDLNLSFFNELVQETTDQSGKAVFDWIPHWHKRTLTIWPRDQDHVHQRAIYDPKVGSGTLTMKLDKLVPLKGRVTFPDGSPAKEISISVSGKGHQIDSFRSTTKTDKDGRYTIKAAPNMVYLVIVNDKKWSSTPQTGFALWPGKPIDNLDFELRPATRLFGHVTVGSPQVPVKGQVIHVYQYGVDAHNKKELKLPNPKKKTFWVQPTIVHSTSSDENGEYELFVGDGKFDIRGPRQNKIEKFEITGELEKQFSFHASRPDRGILEGSVVSGNPSQPVPSAEVFGIYRHTLQPPDMRAETNGSGHFKVDRALHRTVVYARTKDKKLAGVVEIGPDDKTVIIPIRPLGTAFAQLIDVTTKEPLRGREIKFGVRIHLGDENAHWRTSFGGTTITDSEGRFELRNLVLGQNYNISLTNRPKDQPDRVSWKPVGKVKPKDIQPIDLGVLEVAPLYNPPTTKERIITAFKAKGTPLERFVQAKRDAKITIQRPLILFGDPKGEAVQELMTMRYKDQEVRIALESFIVMAVDASAGKRAAARSLAQTLGAKLENGHADFFIVVADEQGKQIANADVTSLSTDGKISKEKFLSFVKAQALQPLDAQELLETALQQAKKENKRIIIQETATWCAPCRLLSRFLEKEREQWERDYIWIKMDHRWIGAREMMKTMRDGADGGVPWWAILDKEGKVLVTSNGEEGKNIGFPSRKNERAHFRTMLEKTAIRLTPEEINSLVDALAPSK